MRGLPILLSGSASGDLEHPTTECRREVGDKPGEPNADSYPAGVPCRQAGLLRPFVLVIITSALLASACGSDAAIEEPLTDGNGTIVDQSITTDDLFAAGDDPLDLTLKPPVNDEYLVPVDELVITDLVVGDGEQVGVGNYVAVQYVGVLASDGSPFDASWDRGATPLEFIIGAGQVIQGWDQGLTGMRTGGRRVVQIPSALAYGEAERPGIPANSDLVFIVDLVEVLETPEPTPTPEPAPEIPEDALGAFDELGIQDLEVGPGPEVQPGDIVTVHYVGVNADTGTEFDSSWGRGTPFSLIAGHGPIIEGWKQGLVGARVGTERILQIPSELAYQEGDLVFRVHVIAVTEAPLAHRQSFSGDAPTEIETKTLVEGQDSGAEPGDVVNARIVVIRYSDSQILESSHLNNTAAPLFVSEPGTAEGLNDSVIGMKAGEIRQIVVPVDTIYPNGVPAELSTVDREALVYVIEVLDITSDLEDLDEG